MTKLQKDILKIVLFAAAGIIVGLLLKQYLGS